VLETQNDEMAIFMKIPPKCKMTKWQGVALYIALFGVSWFNLVLETQNDEMALYIALFGVSWFNLVLETQNDEMGLVLP
jgi:hypothetical protein